MTTPQRTSTLPDVPTMIEAGIPGFIVTQWHGIVAPAGTPKPIVERLYQAIAKSLKQPDVSTRLPPMALTRSAVRRNNSQRI